MTNVRQLFPEPEPDKAVDAEFELLWRSWPVKNGKAVARAKFQGIVKGHFHTKTLDKSSNTFFDMELSASPEQIMAGAKAYLASQVDKNTYRLKDEGRYIPQLGTWLGRAAWEDYE